MKNQIVYFDLLVEALDAFDEPSLLSLWQAKETIGNPALPSSQSLAHSLLYKKFRKRKPKAN
jgi:hypothetical protein